MTEYPCFIDRNHVIEFISKTDKNFGSKLAKHKGSFVWNKMYFAPALDSYLLRIPFDYKGNVVKYGREISKDFFKMRDEETV